MRRKKVELTPEIKETVGYVLEPLPDDFNEIKELVDEVNNLLPELGKMKHTDYIAVRKKLLEISKKSKEMRGNILETYKLFTKEYD